eukprot:417894_1
MTDTKSENPLHQSFNVDKLSPHDVVCLKNLQNKRDWNGKFCTIVKYDKKTGRHQIQIQLNNTSRIVLIKRENLKLIYPSTLIQSSNTTLICMLCQRQIASLDKAISCPDCYISCYCSKQCRAAHQDIDFVTRHSPENIPIELLYHSGYCKAFKESMLQTGQELNKYHTKFNFNILYRQDDFSSAVVFLRSEISQHSQQRIKQGFKDILDKDGSYKYTDVNKPIFNDWDEFYSYHNIPYENPYAVKSNFLLTIYHILTKYIKLSPVSLIDKMKSSINSQTVVIHLICCASSEMLMDIQQMLYLLPGYNFIICAFGNAINNSTIDWQTKFGRDSKFISKKLNINFDNFTKNGKNYHQVQMNSFTNNWILMEYYECLYSKEIVNLLLDRKYRIPAVIIGLNAGFSVHVSELKPVVEYLIQHKIRSVFSERTLSDMYLYHYFIAGFNPLFNYVPNPFRSPMIEQIQRGRVAGIVNGHLCGFNV